MSPIFIFILITLLVAVIAFGLLSLDVRGAGKMSDGVDKKKKKKPVHVPKRTTFFASTGSPVKFVCTVNPAAKRPCTSPDVLSAMINLV